MLVDTIEQDLESAIDKIYQEMDSGDLVTIISQMIPNKIHCNCHYSLSIYSLKN